MLQNPIVMKKILKRFIALRMARSYLNREKTITELERKHFNKSNPGFSDSLYFAGLTTKGFSLVTRMAFRNDKPDENWLKISIPGEGVWGFENYTGHEPAEDGLAGSNRFVQGQLEYICEEPGELWHVKYDGPVFQGKNKYQLHIDLYWHSLVPLADFDKTGIAYDKVAFQIAREKWNKEFFRKVQEIHKVHYEQAGNITGTIRWKRKRHDVQMTGLRGHSYGKREWEEWGRNVWLSGMLDDGRYFHISIVDFSFIKNLKAGFIWNRKEYVTLAKTPSFGDLKLVEPMPKTLSFKIMEPGSVNPVPVRVTMGTFFTFMMDNVYFIRQSHAQFEIGGVKGTGIAEMGINVKKYDVRILDV